MNLLYVCVNYNNSRVTINAVDSFLESCRNAKCVVIDNASNSDDLVVLKERYAIDVNVILLGSDTNVGYFSGLNIGLRYINSENLEYDVVVIGNNDLIFPKLFYQELLNKEELFARYLVVSPNITTSDGVKQNPHVINDISFVRLLVLRLYFSLYPISVLMKIFHKAISSFTDRSDELQHMISQEISQGHGSCYLLSKKFFINFSELMAPTSLYGEEYFLQQQLWSIGARIYYESSICVTHCEHSTVSKIKSRDHWMKMKSAFLLELSMRSSNYDS